MDHNLTQVLLESSVKIGLLFGVMLTIVAYMTLVERRVSAWIQDRRGPNRVGPFGLLQPLADGIKLIAKEDITPKDADAMLFKLEPYVGFAASSCAYIALPFSGQAFAFTGIGVLRINSNGFRVIGDSAFNIFLFELHDATVVVGVCIVFISVYRF